MDNYRFFNMFLKNMFHKVYTYYWLKQWHNQGKRPSALNISNCFEFCPPCLTRKFLLCIKEKKILQCYRFWTSTLVTPLPNVSQLYILEHWIFQVLIIFILKGYISKRCFSQELSKYFFTYLLFLHITFRR